MDVSGENEGGAMLLYLRCVGEANSEGLAGLREVCDATRNFFSGAALPRSQISNLKWPVPCFGIPWRRPP